MSSIAALRQIVSNPQWREAAKAVIQANKGGIKNEAYYVTKDLSKFVVKRSAKGFHGEKLITLDTFDKAGDLYKEINIGTPKLSLDKKFMSKIHHIRYGKKYPQAFDKEIIAVNKPIVGNTGNVVRSFYEEGGKKDYFLSSTTKEFRN